MNDILLEKEATFLPKLTVGIAIKHPLITITPNGR
jgi:hypothetical protein